MEEEEIHLSQKHRFEMVWSRTRSLKKIDLVTQPSKDSGEHSICIDVQGDTEEFAKPPVDLVPTVPAAGWPLL